MQKTVPRAYSDPTLSFQSNKSDNGAINSLKALKNTIIHLELLQDGDTILLPQRTRLHLRHHDGIQAATCCQRGTGIHRNFRPGVNSELFSSVIVPGAHVFLMRILSACLSQPVVTVVQVHTAVTHSDPTHRVAQESRSTLFMSCTETMCCTSLDHTEHEHSFLIFDTIFLTCPAPNSQRA